MVWYGYGMLYLWETCNGEVCKKETVSKKERKERRGMEWYLPFCRWRRYDRMEEGSTTIR